MVRGCVYYVHLVVYYVLCIDQVTQQQSAKVEFETRGQSSKKSWFLHRAGSITASDFKSAACTNSSMPAQSLIKRICYPEAFKFSTAATRFVNCVCVFIHTWSTFRWGCEHEKIAIETYSVRAKQNHTDL